jgi:hypothetical protein
MTNDRFLPFAFPAVASKKITAAFDGGRMTSDGGVTDRAAPVVIALCSRAPYSRRSLAQSRTKLLPDGQLDDVPFEDELTSHPPTSAMGAADPSTAASAAAAESPKPQHPPTAAMNQATQGGTASAPARDTVREPPL